MLTRSSPLKTSPHISQQRRKLLLRLVPRKLLQRLLVKRHRLLLKRKRISVARRRKRSRLLPLRRRQKLKLLQLQKTKLPLLNPLLIAVTAIALVVTLLQIPLDNYRKGGQFISALLALREPCVVELYSDSKYVIDALEKGWAWGWKRRGWVKADKKPALNPDLWDTLLGLTRQHEMHYHWVKGHEANEKNNRCDEQAVLESKKFKR